MTTLIVATDGFEDSELTYPYYRFREAGFDVDLATPDGEDIEGKLGEEMEADLAIDDADADDYEFLAIPGGYSPEQLRMEAPETADIVADFDDADKPIAAICHGVQTLISADVLEGREATGYWTLEVDIENAGAAFVDEPVVVDDNLVTSRAPQDLPEFMSRALKLAEETPAVAD